MNRSRFATEFINAYQKDICRVSLGFDHLCKAHGMLISCLGDSLAYGSVRWVEGRDHVAVPSCAREDTPGVEKYPEPFNTVVSSHPTISRPTKRERG